MGFLKNIANKISKGYRNAFKVYKRVNKTVQSTKDSINAWENVKNDAQNLSQNVVKNPNIKANIHYIKKTFTDLVDALESSDDTVQNGKHLYQDIETLVKSFTSMFYQQPQPQPAYATAQPTQTRPIIPPGTYKTKTPLLDNVKNYFKNTKRVLRDALIGGLLLTTTVGTCNLRSYTQKKINEEQAKKAGQEYVYNMPAVEKIKPNTPVSKDSLENKIKVSMKKGDNLWNQTKKELKEELGKKPTNKEIYLRTDENAQASGKGLQKEYSLESRSSKSPHYFKVGEEATLVQKVTQNAVAQTPSENKQTQPKQEPKQESKTTANKLKNIIQDAASRYSLHKDLMQKPNDGAKITYTAKKSPLEDIAKKEIAITKASAEKTKVAIPKYILPEKTEKKQPYVKKETILPKKEIKKETPKIAVAPKYTPLPKTEERKVQENYSNNKKIIVDKSREIAYLVIDDVVVDYTKCAVNPVKTPEGRFAVNRVNYSKDWVFDGKYKQYGNWFYGFQGHYGLHGGLEELAAGEPTHGCIRTSNSFNDKLREIGFGVKDSVIITRKIDESVQKRMAEEYRSSEKTVAQLAEEHNVSETTFRKYSKQHNNGFTRPELRTSY